MRSFTVYSSARPAAPDKQRPGHDVWFSMLYRLRLALLSLILLAAGFVAFGREVPALYRSVGTESGSAGLASPLTALLSRLDLWELPNGGTAWRTIALAAYAAAVWLSVLVAYRGRRWLPRLFIAAIALLVFPVYADLRQAGSGPILLLLLTLSFYGYDRGRAAAAGVPLGIAIGFNPSFFPILLYFAWKRQRSYVSSSLIALGATVVLTGSAAGFRLYEDTAVSFANALFGSSPQGGTADGGFFLDALALTGWSPAAVRLVYWIVLFVLASLVALMPDLRRSVGSRFDLLTASMCALWFSPVQGSSDLLLMLTAYAILIGIVAEKYGESAAPLRMAAGEQGGMACFLVSAVLLSLPVESAWGSSSPLFEAAAVHVLLIPILVLSRKLARTQSRRRTIPLKDYRLRRSRSRGN